MKNNIKVVEQRCPANHACPAVWACPKGAIIQNGHSAPNIDKDKCTSCGVCLNYCPFAVFQK